MSWTHQELREAIGSYVLGHLDGSSSDDASLRSALETHLETCADCRAEVADLAPLRQALRSVDPDLRPTGLDQRIAAALDREIEGRDAPGGRKRWGWRPAVAGVLVGAAATAAVVTVVRDPVAPSPVVVAIPSLQTSTGVAATAGLVDHTWGLELRLRMTGLPGGQAYDVRVLDASGREYDSGEFRGVAGTTITCSMSASVLAVDARHFEVLDPAGAVVIKGDLPT